MDVPRSDVPVEQREPVADSDARTIGDQFDVIADLKAQLERATRTLELTRDDVATANRIADVRWTRIDHLRRENESLIEDLWISRRQLDASREANVVDPLEF